MMKKLTAIFLAVVLVACCFATVATVSATDTNILLNASYTVSGTATPSTTLVDTDGKLITDGKYRGDGTNNFNANSGVAGVSLEYMGSYAQTSVEFAFDDATTIGALVIKSARAFFVDSSVNRHLNVVSVEVTTDGLNYTAATTDVEYVAIADAPECEAADKTTGTQYYDVVINIDGAADIMGIKLTVDTLRADGSNGYIVQFDEIEGYANKVTVEAPVVSEEPSAEPSEEPSEAPVVSEEPSEESVVSEESAVSEDSSYTNVALGRPYSYSNSDDAAEFFGGAAKDEDCKLLTDGVVRKLFHLGAGGEPTRTISVELAGTYRVHSVTIDLDGLNTIDKVVLDIARRGGNRYTNINKIEVSVKGGEFVPVEFVEEKVAVTDAPQYSEDKGVTVADQFFTLNANFEAIADVTAIRVSIDTAPAEGTADQYIIAGSTGRGYIAQLDEIMVMGTRTGDFESNNDNNVEAGDLGLGVFAVLAVVSLAGVVVAKKVK